LAAKEHKKRKKENLMFLFVSFAYFRGHEFFSGGEETER
jgi:hypothetical protein